MGASFWASRDAGSTMASTVKAGESSAAGIFTTLKMLMHWGKKGISSTENNINMRCYKFSLFLTSSRVYFLLFSWGSVAELNHFSWISMDVRIFEPLLTTQNVPLFEVQMQPVGFLTTSSNGLVNQNMQGNISQSDSSCNKGGWVWHKNFFPFIYQTWRRSLQSEWTGLSPHDRIIWHVEQFSCVALRTFHYWL